jgi:hypothetical protein
MDELRSEIRSAFEKEQAANPPPAALRRDVVAAVTTHTRPTPNLQWLAVAAAVLLGFAVVAGLMSSRLAHHAPVPVNNPKASPVADYGPPPAGVPLLYVRDPQNASWLIGYDWSGNPRGTVKFAPAVSFGVQMAPDGSAFEVGGTYKGGSGTFMDRLGQPIPAVGASPNVAGALWADDNKHQCLVTLNQQTFVWGLSTQLPGQAARPVGVIARDPGIGQTGISLVACSFRSNLALAIRTTIASPAELWAIRLSDGKVLSHRTYQAQQLATVVASRDGLYVAESSGSYTPPQIPQPTIIRRVADGKQVASLGPSVQVIAFSADDSQLLVSNVPLYSNMDPARIAVINWTSGQPVWTYSGTEAFGSFTAQPDGNGFAVALMEPTRLSPDPCGGTDQTACSQFDDPLRDVVIVHGDGSTTAIPGRYELTW